MEKCRRSGGGPSRLGGPIAGAIQRFRWATRRSRVNLLALCLIAALLTTLPIPIPSSRAEAAVNSATATTVITPDGTGTTGSFSSLGCSGNYWGCVDDDLSSPDDDSSYVRGPNASDSNMYLDLSAMPSDFVAPASVKFIYRQRSASCTDDNITVNYRLLQNDATTPLTEWVWSTATVSSSYFTDYSVLTLTSNAATSRTTWNGARLQISQDHTASGGSDASCHARITGVSLEIKYISSGVPKISQTGYIFENDDEDQSFGDAVDENTQQAAGNTPITGVKKGERITVRTQLKNTGDALTGRELGLFYDRGDGRWTKVGHGEPPITSSGNCDADATFDCATIDSSGNVGRYTSTAIGADGRPWIAYYDSSNADVKVAINVGSGGNCGPSNSWSCSTVDSSGNQGSNVSMAMDGSGKPWLSWYDLTNGNLRVAHYVGSGGDCANTAWDCTDVDTTNDVGRWTSIAINPATNSPWVSYYDASNSDLKVAYYDGDGSSSGCANAAWTCSVIDNNNAGDFGSSIAFDPSGIAHVVYFYYTNGDLKLATYVGSGGDCVTSTWECDVIDTHNSTGWQPQLAFDASGRAIVTSEDDDTGNLRVAIKVGSGGSCLNTQWNCSNLTNTNWGSYSALATAPDGSIWVAYADSNGSDKDLKLARYDGDAVPSGCDDAAWTCSTIESTGAVGDWVSIAFDHQGRPWIAHSDEDNRDLKVAFTNRSGEITYAAGLAGKTGDLHNESHADMSSVSDTTARDNTDCIGGGTWTSGIWAESDVEVDIGGSQCTEVSFVIDTTQATSGVTYRFVVATRDYWRSDRGPWRGPATVSYFPTLTIEASTTTRISKDALFKMSDCDNVDWGCDVVDNLSQNSYNTMAIAPDNTPWIAYRDFINNDLRWARFVGTGGSGCGTTGNSAWICGTIDSSGSVGENPSLAFDSRGNAWVAYNDGDGHRGDLRVARYVGSGGVGCASTEWTCTVVDTQGWTGTDPSIAIDKNGHAWISYFDFSNFDLKVARYVGSGGTGCGSPGSNEWTCLTVDSSGDVGNESSIALDSHNRPWIAYRDVNNSSLKVARMTPGTSSGCAAAGWSCTLVDSGAGNAGSNSSIAIDHNDIAWISYHDITNLDMRVARYDGDGSSSGCTASVAWTCELVGAGDEDAANGTSIAIDSTGAPWIAFQHKAWLESQTSYARYVGSGGTGCNVGTWTCVNLDTNPWQGDKPSIAFDRSGTPWIASNSLGGGSVLITKMHTPPNRPSNATLTPYDGRSFHTSGAAYHLDWGDNERPVSGACGATTNNRGYCGVVTAGSSLDSVSTATSATPTYVITQSNNTNSTKFGVTWTGQSTVAPSSNPLIVQVYRFGSTNAWETLTPALNTCASTGANSNCTISALPAGTTSEYWESDSGKYWTYFRVMQTANSGGVNFKTDLISASEFTPPDEPTGLAQKKVDDTALSTGAWSNSTSVKFTATVSSPTNPDSLALCVEAVSINSSFANTETGCGTPVAYSGSGVTASVTLVLADATQFHWQARVKDQFGLFSSWESYGSNSDVVTAARDFGIDTTAPTGGTVYDGASPTVDGSFNNGSLNTLDANWSGFNADVSGLSEYQYSIGTSPGGTDIKSWTSNGSSTSVSATGLSLRTSQPYYFNVRAIDNAGNTSNVVSSNGQSIAPSLTFVASDSTITFDSLNSGNSFTSTKTLQMTTSTNGYSGYKIRAMMPNPPTSNSVQFPAFSGASGATSADAWLPGEYGLGYTVDDTSVGGSNIWQAATCPGGNSKTGAGCYAPFVNSPPGDLIADHTGPVVGNSISAETFTMTLTAKADPTQPAGLYNTVIRLSVVAEY